MIAQKERYTTDYSIFKRLEGNRSVSKMRVGDIKNSISKYGYVGAPVVVNEKMEVIDGQGRLAACKELNVPVPYIIRPGTTVTDCMALNRSTLNWKDSDYVKSYAEQGNISYKYLQILIEKYHLPLSIVHFAATFKQNGGGNDGDIRKGTFTMTSEAYNKADEILQKFMPLRALVRKARAHTARLSYAVIFAIADPNVNYPRLCEAFERRYIEIEPYSTIEPLLDEVGRIYNYGLRDEAKGGKLKKLFLRADYQKMKMK